MRTAAPEPEGSTHTYRVEIWSDPPEAGGEIIEVISLSTSFNVSCTALKAAIRERPGKYVVHLNGKHRMSCELAPDPPLPLPCGRSAGGGGLSRRSTRPPVHLRNAA